MWKKAEKILSMLKGGKNVLSNQSNNFKNLDEKKQIDNSKIVLAEMHRLSDKGWDSLNRWSEIAIAGLGLEVSVVTFGFSEKGILGDIGNYFSNLQDGWFVLAILMAGAWAAATILFVVSIACRGKIPFPPDVNLLVYARRECAKHRYKRVATLHLYDELVDEYCESSRICADKARRIRGIVLAGIYCLTAGAVLLLILKLK